MVLLGDNRECKIRGIDKVRVQLKDGSSFVLHNVRYILELKRNLILMGTLEKEGYTINFSRAKSRRVWVYILRFKHEAFGKFKEWKQLVENQTGRTVKKLSTNNGLAFYNGNLSSYALRSGLSKTLWAKARCTTAYLINRLYSLDNELPKIVTSRNVVFNKSVMYKDTLKDSGAYTDKYVEELHIEVELQGLNIRTLEVDKTDQEYGNDEDAGD
nr:retrovirus-related Pol polyprotein from transposon TNT 1-94 [Tanacetum cinerariifolium]GEX65222.1 retrovirus-related Pol polyprotein from transposon TNT 1-94 [Tanacetum cinerariifolium]